MIAVGIDVSKSKHDCYILSYDGEVLNSGFTFSNDRKGFDFLLKQIALFPKDIIKVGLEATGHYSANLISFLTDNGLSPIVLNPLQTNLYRKAQTLRKTKTDKTDARLIASMIISGEFNTHSELSYHVLELKSLTRHRFRLIKKLSNAKIELVRILDVMFPELENLVYSTSQKSTLALLKELPSLNDIANCHLTKLSNILKKNSKGKYSKEKAIQIREAAKSSIGSKSIALSFELKQAIALIEFLDLQVDELDSQIKEIMDELSSPILSIPGISYTLGSSILAEIGDVSRFESPSKLLAFAGLEPGISQSGKFVAQNMTMVKRGSPYLRNSVLQAARLVAMKDETFKRYYLKKKSEGKHFYVCLSHVARKLIRVIFHLLSTNQNFISQNI